MQGAAPTDVQLAAAFALCGEGGELSKAELAELVGVSRQTIHRWLADGRAEAAYDALADSPELRRELARLLQASGGGDREIEPPPVAEPADVIDVACRSIVEAALWPREALIDAGVPPTRAEQWEREARAAEPESELGELWRRVRWAETRLERELNERLVNQSGGWQAARELRARRFPQRYGSVDGGTVIVRPLEGVPLDELAFVLGP